MTERFGASARFDALREINSRTPRKFDPPRDEKGRRLKISEFFGTNTFDLNLMKEKLPKDAYQKLLAVIGASTDKKSKLDPETAGIIANAIKEWALDRGVTHFCHWFQPQTGSTAEKHDAFLSLDDNGRTIEKFSGSQLIQSEPDASSFPSGGMRTTFEARGYTAWDPSSPVFIMDTANTKTLCIPSVFISYHGDALDEKTGLLRSMEVLSQKACELLKVMGLPATRRVVATLGVEQEYFLIDRAFYSLRPDLVMSGRTLVGGQPPKGQQLEDHYFGSIPARVQAFMAESEYELYKLGVPIKTRHNEVAPSQFETAPIFEEANIATDHNQLVMEVLRKTATRHQFACLMHEKPFAGVNGSGKHNNWSMQVVGGELDGENLLDPGKTPHENIRFLMFLCATLKGVNKHAGLLRAGIASSGNDHRLGANEAPPAIISCFLGNSLDRILNEIESGAVAGASAEKAIIALGVDKIPEVMRDNTDRNRTSPFAFTGNKFEFRAVGSSASTAFPMTLVNGAVADGLSETIDLLKSKLASSKTLDVAIMETMREVIKETKFIRFEGNGYSEDWVKEAAKRNLLNLRKTPEALAQMVTKTSVEMLTKMGIFSEAEVHSRYHVRLERFVKNMLIEVETLRNIADTMLFPSALSYHGALAQGAANAKTAGLPLPQVETINKLSSLIQNFGEKRKAFESAAIKAESTPNDGDKAKILADLVAPAMVDLRQVSDELEAMVADDYWPMPKYREMLFLSTS